jgi:hypothetical protein
MRRNDSECELILYSCNIALRSSFGVKRVIARDNSYSGASFGQERSNACVLASIAPAISGRPFRD